MMIRPTFATLALLAGGLLLPADAEPGKLRGATRQETVKKEQSVVAYARSWGLAAEQIAWANGISAAGRLEKGRKVTLPARILPPHPPENGAVVNLAERGMYLFAGGEFKGFFPLAIGSAEKKEYRTPTGTFKINSRLKNPDWVAPKSAWARAAKKEKIKGDDAKNPLGEYWFGFDHPDPGYGFHANVNPQTTGDRVSHGCLRLYPEHAARIFKQGLLAEGDTVRIEHRPVVLGKDSHGRPHLAVFPNAYGKTPTTTTLSALLKKEGLADLFPAPSLKSLSASKSGVPRPLFGKPVALLLDGKPVGNQTVTARRAGSLLLPASLARELGAQVSYQADTGQILIKKDGQAREYSLKDGQGKSRAFRYGDQVLVPARALLTGLGVPFAWNAKRNQLEIDA